MKASELAWFNGALMERERANPSIASNTLHLGTAVFDGMMAYWNDDHWHLHFGREHLQRFLSGAGHMDLVLSWSADELLAGVRALVDTLPADTHYIRPIAYRTGPEVFFQVDEESTSACIFAVPVGRDVDAGYRCQLSAVRRVPHEAIPATWKVSGAYANSYLAERNARADGFDTGIMLDIHGRIAEASSSNLFFVRGDTLVTPRLTGDIFPGITRSMLIDLAAGAGIPVTQRDIWPRELTEFDAAFLCGTLSEVRPISQISDFHYRSESHSLVRFIIESFRTRTHQ
jgi:branched-chain amino acid aminotransferase